MDYKAELTSTGGYISIGYAENVENTAEVRSAVLNGRLNSTVLRGCLIPDPLLITVAGNKVALAEQRNNLRLISPLKVSFTCFLKTFRVRPRERFLDPHPLLLILYMTTYFSAKLLQFIMYHFRLDQVKTTLRPSAVARSGQGADCCSQDRLGGRALLALG